MRIEYCIIVQGIGWGVVTMKKLYANRFTGEAWLRH